MKKLYLMLLLSASLLTGCETEDKTSTEEISSISVTPEVLILTVNETAALSAEVLPENASDYTLEWTSSDISVATVDENGTVTGIAEGEAVITVSAGGVSDEATVTVTPSGTSGSEIQSITVSPKTLELEIEGSATLTAEVLPENASDYTLEWTSSDMSVATVDENGTVTGIAEGEAVITVSAGGVSDEATVTVVSDLPQEDAKVGDYLYSDGTWSSNLNQSKDVIGIIFYTGDPSKDDDVLKAEHPECTNGLAVAIDGDKPTPWQSSYAQYGRYVGDWVLNNTDYETIYSSVESGNINKMLGYNNTKAIQAFNDDPSNAAWPVEVISALTEYQETHPAPDNTSGWYLPSIKEYIIMCYDEINAYAGALPDNHNFLLINEKLSKVPGAQLLGSDELGLGAYSSSTEFYGDYSKAFAIAMCYSTVATNTKENESLYSVRFILAF